MIRQFRPSEALLSLEDEPLHDTVDLVIVDTDARTILLIRRDGTVSSSSIVRGDDPAYHYAESPLWQEVK